MTSILTSIKKLLGIDEEYTHFDVDITMYINSALMILNQLGVVSDEILITDKNDSWGDVIGDSKRIESIKIYVYLKVRLSFDPPTTSFAIEAIERQITELEWRLNNQVEGVITDE
jgi:hypothetical protein